MKRLSLLFLVTVLVSLLNGCGDTQITLTDTQWQWATITEDAARVYKDDPESFVLVFRQDGTLEAKADCEQISGTYEMTGSDINLALNPTDEVECGGPATAHDSFIGFLKNVQSYELGDGGLTLILTGGTPKLGFRDGGPAE